jgi:hypothetical protein
VVCQIIKPSKRDDDEHLIPIMIEEKLDTHSLGSALSRKISSLISPPKLMKSKNQKC